MTEDLETKIARDAILRDTQFVARYISSAVNPQMDGKLFAISSLAFNSYMALFTWESRKKWKSVRADAATPPDGYFDEIVERSRNSVKLFEDDKRRIRGQLQYFKNEILEEHRLHFLSLPDDAGHPRPEATDLGVYRYDDAIICTTHSASFGLGVAARHLLSDSELIHSIADKYGRYFGSWGAEITDSTSFLDHLDGNLMSVEEDVRSSNFYAQTFNEVGPEEFNGFLSILQSQMNFTHKILPRDTQEESFQTSFKIRFLVLFHVVRSVNALMSKKDLAITPRSLRFILGIISEPTAKLIIKSPDVKDLRKSLMHYKPEGRSTRHMSISEPIYGLLASGFPDRPYDKALDSIYACADNVTSLLNEWAGSGVET